MSLRLSVIMFAYNEEENVRPVVESVIATLESWMADKTLSDYQLVLVDDGSTDNTSAEIEALAAANPRITPLSHGMNRGIGAAVKSGFAASRMDYVTIVPADGQLRMSEVFKLVEVVESGAEMAVGYYTQRLDVDGKMRMFLSRGLREMMRLALGVRQPMDGVYLFKRSLLKKLPLSSDSFFVNLELPVRAVRTGHDVRFIPVEVSPRRSGRSKVLHLSRMMSVGKDVISLRANFVRERFARRSSS